MPSYFDTPEFGDFWNDLWSGGAQDFAWGEGSLSTSGENIYGQPSAMYTGADGSVYKFGRDTQYSDVRNSSPGIASYWDDLFFSPAGDTPPIAVVRPPPLLPGGTLLPDTPPPGDGSSQPGFDIPSGLFPWNMSTGNSQSQSGMNWGDPYASGILSQLLSLSQGLPALAQKLPETLQDYYTNMMSNALGPEAFQGTLNNLASRNMLNSSVASDALASAGATISKEVGNKAYESLLQGLVAEMGIPSTLGNLASMLGKTTSSQNVSMGYQENKLAPYELMSRMLMGLM